MILHWLIAPEWANLVQALLHTLWQGAVIAILLGGALRQWANPVVRYRCSLAALVGILVAGVVTWSVLNRPLPQPAAVVAARPAVPVMVAAVPASGQPPPVVNFARPEPRATAVPWSAWLALSWLLGASVMVFRGGWQVAGAERLRRAARPSSADERLTALLAEARRAVGLTRRVRLAVTDRLMSPVVVGVLVPTLILPLSLVSTLTPEQIRFVLLHELAHIRRGDYFACLFQLFVEALLFFNPAVWWISRQMRREREACCDTLAVELSGAPVAYARTLLRVAENVLQPAPAAAPAFGDRRETSSLAERVQRMLVPGYQPKLRLTWRAMLLALVVGGGLLFLSALGTSVTVAAILSPQQRIERIEKKMAELGESPEANLSYAEAEKAPPVEVSGRVRMADGSPLPKDVYVNAVSIVKNSSSGTGFFLETNATFHASLRPGQIILSTELAGYAPVQLGPLLCLGTNRLDQLELVISSGFNAVIQLVDAVSGQPVAGGKLTARFWLRGCNQTSFRETALTTDANGMATLAHATDLPLVIMVNTPGYEILEKKLPAVKAGEPLRLTVPRGASAAGLVLNKSTGQPVGGAIVRMLSEDGPTISSYGWDSSQRILAQTDAQGRFTITQLRSDTVYRLGVNAPGLETVVLNPVRAGMGSLTARLGPELIVKGRLTGNLSRLEAAGNNPGQAELAYTFEDETEGHRQSWGGRALVRMTNGTGYFQFTNPFAGRVKLYVPGETLERRVTEPVEDWAIEVKASAAVPAVSRPQREVVFRFKHSSGVLSHGTVSVTIPDSLEPSHLTAHSQELEITNGEVRVQIAVGGQTGIEPKRMVGYGFNRSGPWESPTGERGNWLSFVVPPGVGPLVVEIPLIPAGAIYAKAHNADGTPAGGLMFGVKELKRAPGRDQNSLESGSDSFSGDAPRQWVSGPLPLGGKYQIYGWRGNAFCVSQPIKLTEATPDAEVQLQFTPGQTFDGVVLDADGKALPEAELKLSFSLSGNHGFGLKSVFTDAQGRFHLESLTPDLGAYTVEAQSPGMLAERVKLKFGSAPQTIRLQRGRTLAGRVVEAGTGLALPDMEIRALDYDRNLFPMLTTRTDADGHFVFTQLGNANYTLYPDGGEPLAWQRSGNQKFPADGRTNLTLHVKLYEWSRVKPKVPTVAATNVSGIMSDPNFRVALQALEQHSGAESLSEPEVTTSSGRGRNRLSLPITFATSNSPAAANSNMARSFFTRSFKVDANVFISQLRNQEVGVPLGEVTNSSAISEAARKFYGRLGVNWELPAGKSVSFNDKTGVLLVKATEADLDMVERAMVALNDAAPQIHLKARFYSVPQGTFRDWVQPNLLTEGPVNALKSETNVWAGLLSEEKLRTVLSALNHKLEVEELAEPEGTTLSGRQIQMKVTEPAIYVSDIIPGEQFQTSDSPTNRAGNLPGLQVITNSLEVGPSLDAIASLLSDGQTVHLWTFAALTKFSGYESNAYAGDTGNNAKSNGSGPLKIFPMIRVQQAGALLNVWDGQTVFLGSVGEPASFMKKLTKGQWLDVPPKGSSNKELLVFITVNLVDPAGNRIHRGDEMPFEGIPPQPVPGQK